MRVCQRDEESTVRKNRLWEEEVRTEPKNAFDKKCFQKKRAILPIHDLLDR